MPVTSRELIYAQSFIGTTETSDAFNGRFDAHLNEVVGEGSLDTDTQRRKEALHRAIEESLRAQLSAFTLDQPSSASASGKSYSNVQNLVTLQKELQNFQKQHGNAVRPFQLYRPDAR